MFNPVLYSTNSPFSRKERIMMWKISVICFALSLSFAGVVIGQEKGKKGGVDVKKDDGAKKDVAKKDVVKKDTTAEVLKALLEEVQSLRKEVNALKVLKVKGEKKSTEDDSVGPLEAKVMALQKKIDRENKSIGSLKKLLSSSTFGVAGGPYQKVMDELRTRHAKVTNWIVEKGWLEIQIEEEDEAAKEKATAKRAKSKKK